MTARMVRKYWWLALIAGGWLLVHNHAPRIRTDRR